MVTVLLFLEDLSAPKPFRTVRKEGSLENQCYALPEYYPAFKSSLTQRNVEFKRFGGKELESPT